MLQDRLVSLDVFRGITIAAMILVNNPGDWNTVYAPLLHADWHGATPTDWIFPFFLFIVGVAIALALGRRLEAGSDHSGLLRKIIKRTLIIFGIGLFLSGFPFFDLSTIRIPGVLQRIGLVYGACSLLFVYTSPRTQWLVAIGLLLGYWALLTLVPVPDGNPPNLAAETNLGAWLDRTLLSGHLWSQSRVWDPEGLLSTLPAVATGLSGIFAGRWLQRDLDPWHRLAGLLLAGTIVLALGLLWHPLFPINKKIWTSSYVLYSSGLALLFLGVVYWLVDMRRARAWATPFVIYGSNALFIFVLSGLLAKSLYLIQWANADGEVVSLGSRIYHTFFTSWLSPYNASLGYAIAHVLVLLLVGWVLYRRRIFIKV